MRMWMIKPEYMCTKHICGEHGEIHKFKHTFEKKFNMNKRLVLNQIFPQMMKDRHDELAKYLNHKSEYIQPSIDHLPDNGVVEFNDFVLWFNIKDLATRCKSCYDKMLDNMSSDEIRKLRGMI